jgi:biopolymer transport protein ExbD
MPTNAFDVWFVSADQVYKGVPFQVVAGWAEQGRAAETDRVRPTGINAAWQLLRDHPLLRDYLPGRMMPTVAVPGMTTAAHVEHVEPPEPEYLARKPADDDDDDVDMIPLIDISLVLLVFFMMTTAVAALSPIDVPAISSGQETAIDADSLTVQIDLRNTGEAFYSLRIGEQAVERENNNLETQAALVARLDAVLARMNRPPEVRIACHKQLKHVRVRELAVDLEARLAKGQITLYTAEVNEQPKK